MNDGGPAFPPTIVFPPNGGVEQYEGMSLRDWFAGQALTGFLARIPFVNTFDDIKQVRKHMDLLPSFSYEIADAMLVEQAKKKE